jgi:ubiquinone/menaquinone biosynthesis C-methylase UbiE
MLSLDDPTAWKDRTGWKPSIGGDIAHLPFKSGCADGVICKDVLEHVPDPFSAVREIHRVMKPGSPGFFTVPFLHPYHAVRGSGAFDYWRFTRDGAKKLFEAFPSVQVERAGGAVFVVEQFLGRAQTFLLPRLLSPLWNLVDRSVPTRETTHLWMIRIRR